MEEVLEAVQQRVFREMNDGLLKPFLPEEIDTTLSQMHPMKVPGPNGYGVCFSEALAHCGRFGQGGSPIVSEFCTYTKGFPCLLCY
jgi:hypothetical protein